MTDGLTQLMTKKEVAKYFKVSESTIDRWRREGLIASVTLGRCIRFRVDTVEMMSNDRPSE